MIHYRDNDNFRSDIYDRTDKVRRLITAILEWLEKFGILEEDPSIDEVIVRYHEHNSLEQYKKGEPIRFGYYFWVTCAHSDYSYNFDMFWNKSKEDEMIDVWLLKVK